MKTCRVTMATVADGKKTEIIRDGKMFLADNRAELVYTEENATITLVFDKGAVYIERQGDYTMRLTLKKGEKCNGMLGIGGAEGQVQTQTSRLAYSLTENSLMLSLHYDLFVGNEPQNIRLRLFSKIV